MKDYQTLISIVIAVIAFAVIVTMVLKAKKRNREKSDSETSSGIETSSELELDLKKDDFPAEESISKEKKPKIYISSDLKNEELFYETDSNHMIKKILIYHEKEAVWVCPYCETENPLSNTRCFLCNHGH